ncbi:2-oxoacid:acceptor oxidoreductase subunit alpha [Phosphitispora fastidiosa]|uniref:2-oxoacid:acceptor oxidoreductase subunit alpha n=1 Tax=Phosphitispora fastidiosa TaxID=2837202 RepID=UPI001E59F1BF|nr:2-oxoacid:acceptor oxidoreductase subunit alpha [Phosphitispora fastidiosa]MBU7006970.1 2-oxoglutarate ferredoxin oxidoreductase subunit alpha [Phosphitispora fastidiosa]
MDEKLFLQGNEACVRGALAAGAAFYAGYPISPSTEIAELCSQMLPEHGGVFIQMEDEIASIAAVIGASLGGMKAFTATSGPGFSLMQENLGMAVMAEIPCVIINVQRFGPATGIATKPAQADVMQSRYGTHGDYEIIVLVPSSVQECYELTLEAFNLAERFRTPVILLSDAALAHLREQVVIPGDPMVVDRNKPGCPPGEYLPYGPGPNLIPPMAAYGSPHIMRVTGLVHDERGYSTADNETADNLLRRLAGKIKNYSAELPQPLYWGDQDAEILLVAYGVVTRAARAAVVKAREAGISVGLLQLRTLWPFPDQAVAGYLGKVKQALVPEMNLGQVVREVRRVNEGKAEIHLLSRTDAGIITPEQIVQKLREVV